MFDVTYLAAMKYWNFILIGGLLCLTQSLTAQFRTEKRSADKAFELHAYNLAIESYQRALSYRSDDGETLARLGDAYRMLNQLDSARLYYERALEDRRVAPETLLAYAQTLKSLGRYDEATPLFLAYARETDSSVGNQYARSSDFAVDQQNEDAGFTVTSLNINSSGADFGPNLPLGEQFVFSSARIDEDFSGVATNRPYVAQVIGQSEMSSPTPVVFNYNAAAGNIGPVSYSPDGTQVVFSRNNFTPGTRMVPEAGITLSLLIADVNAAGEWINVRPLPVNGNDYNTGFATFGPDGNTLYFASDRPGGAGGYDVYRIRRDLTGWESTPENLGSTVNSRGNEITPYSDGESLYFSSDWHQGLGAYDVFRAAMEGQRPVRLFHLGGAVNSPRDDFGFVFDAARGEGYVVSNRSGGKGQEDIYSVRYKTPPVMTESDDAEVATDEARPQSSVPEGVVANTPVPFGTVRGYVSNMETGSPVQYAEVTVTQRNTGTKVSTRTDAEGAYYVSVQPATVYDVLVNAQGYEAMSFPVTTGDGQDSDVFGNIMILPVQSNRQTNASRPPVVNKDEVAPPAPTVTDEPASEAPAPTVAAAPPVATEARQGYAVQIASLGSRPDLSVYGNTGTLGQVYATEQNGSYKVKVGTFATRDEALVAARQLGTLGYTGSFVMQETNTSTVPSTGSVFSSAIQAPYRIQLGAFSKPENFDRAAAEKLGPLSSVPRGELTVFYITAPDRSTAETIHKRATDGGYPGAYILQLVDGDYRKLPR